MKWDLAAPLVVIHGPGFFSAGTRMLPRYSSNPLEPLKQEEQKLA